MNNRHPPPPSPSNNSGQTLVVALAFLVVTAILMPVLIRLMSEDIRWTQKSQAALEAQQGADFALLKAEWYLQGSTEAWNRALLGLPHPQFPKSTAFNSKDDVEYGSRGDRTDTVFLYNARISSVTSSPGVVRITATARSDTRPYTFRTIEADYTKYVLSALEMVNNFDVNSTTLPTVHWGPLTSHNPTAGLGLSTLVLPRFPRRYSAGPIQTQDPSDLGRDLSNDDDNAHNASSSWAYQRDLQRVPQVDLNYYIRRATSTVLNIGAGLALSNQPSAFNAPTASPLNSGYFNNDSDYYFGNVGGGQSFDFDSPGSVLCFDPGNPARSVFISSNTFMHIEALVVINANLVVGTLVSGGKSNYPTSYPLLPGFDPQIEYLYSGGSPPVGGPVNNVFLDGLLIVNGTNRQFILNEGARVSIIGAAYVNQLRMLGAGPQVASLTLYYQPTVALNAAIMDAPLKRIQYSILNDVDTLGASW